MSESDDSHLAELTAHELHLWRGEHHLLRGVSFALAAGQLLQVSGRNGTGKTSLLRVVAGLLPAESGEVKWRTHGIHQNFANYSAELAYLGHANALKGDLTVLENLHFSGSLRQGSSHQRCVQTLNELNISQCAQLPVKALSAGQRRRVALASVLLSDALLWILDEPITNLDTAGIQLVESLMAVHLARGGMILTAAHQDLLPSYANRRSLTLH